MVIQLNRCYGEVLWHGNTQRASGYPGGIIYIPRILSVLTSYSCHIHLVSSRPIVTIECVCAIRNQKSTILLLSPSPSSSMIFAAASIIVLLLSSSLSLPTMSNPKPSAMLRLVVFQTTKCRVLPHKVPEHTFLHLWHHLC